MQKIVGKMFPNTSIKFTGEQRCQNLQGAHTEVCVLNYMRAISRDPSNVHRTCHIVRFLGHDFVVPYSVADAVDLAAMNAALLEKKILPQEAQVCPQHPLHGQLVQCRLQHLSVVCPLLTIGTASCPCKDWLIYTFLCFAPALPV